MYMDHGVPSSAAASGRSGSGQSIAESAHSRFHDLRHASGSHGVGPSATAVAVYVAVKANVL